MIRDPRCDNDNCEPDAGRWVHAPECQAAADAQSTDDMALATAREDGYSDRFIPAQREWRWAA